MWSIARYDLSLSLEEFGTLSLAQFEALLDRAIESQRRQQINAGIVAAAVFNANPFRAKNSRGVSPLDFVAEDPRKRQSEMDVEAQGLAFIAAWSGIAGKNLKKAIVQ
jgi:hypothetical protein